MKNMTRRKPGAGQGGRGLNRALADAGLGELRRQLGYKDHLVRLPAPGGRPVVPQFEDLLGVWRGESQAGAARAHLSLRRLRPVAVS